MKLIRRAVLLLLICARVQGALLPKEETDHHKKDTITRKRAPRTGLLRRAKDNAVSEVAESDNIERLDLLSPCTDTPSGWHDKDGYDCDWYARTTQSCSFYGHLFANQGLTANEACCACGGGSTSAANAGAGPPDNGFNGESFSIITSHFNNDCMSVDSADDNNVVIWHCTIGKYQKWDFFGNKIKNMKYDNLCLDWNRNTDNVSMQVCNGMSNQDWFIDFTNNGGIFRVSSPTQGRCLTLDLDGSYTSLKVENCRNTVRRNQKFDVIIYN
mmetsp:Transcript_12148/g.18449  ORF Transcript_12148/g.18449 Transcript_12148/m.18449 type:complete len:271 (-) Transcript_12148:62-874(-)